MIKSVDVYFYFYFFTFMKLKKEESYSLPTEPSWEHNALAVSAPFARHKPTGSHRKQQRINQRRD